MIRRRPPRPGRAVQDFQFFAATQRPMGIEPRDVANPNPPSELDAPPDAPSADVQAGAPLPEAHASVTVPALPPKAAVATPPTHPAPANSLAPATVTLERSSAKKAARPSTPRSAPRSAVVGEGPFAKRYSPAPDDRSGSPHHERHCTICRHPERSAIDNEFIHWFPTRSIAVDYQVSRCAIFRHAHATNLFERRNRNIRFALGHIIERACDVEPTADSIVRAVHAFARVNDGGQWVEPPSHVIVSSGSARHVAQAASRPPIDISLDASALQRSDEDRCPERASSRVEGARSGTPIAGSTRDWLSSRK